MEINKNNSENIYKLINSIIRPYAKKKLMGAVFRHAVNKAIEDNLISFIEQGEEIVGFFLLRKRKRDNAIVLEKIAIKEEHKNKGYGKILLNKIKHIAIQNNMKIELKVVSSNSDAIAFYKINNFIETDKSMIGKNKDIELTTMVLNG